MCVFQLWYYSCYHTDSWNKSTLSTGRWDSNVHSSLWLPGGQRDTWLLPSQGRKEIINACGPPHSAGCPVLIWCPAPFLLLRIFHSWGCISSRMLAWHLWSPRFNPHYCRKDSLMFLVLGKISGSFLIWLQINPVIRARGKQIKIFGDREAGKFSPTSRTKLWAHGEE